MTTTAAIQKQEQKPKSQLEIFKEYLELRKSHIAQVIPKHVTPERILKVALTAYNRTPALKDCDMASVFMAVMQAAELGLEPGGALGHAYLVPYNVKDKESNRWVKQCQLIPGYRGLIELARRSGEIESVEAHVVHANDKFQVKFGLTSVLEHEPTLDGEPGLPKFVYAVARLKGGAVQFEVMSVADVEKIRVGSKAKDSGPWVDHWSEMARKTVIRRLMKYLPLSPEKAQPLASALDIEDEGLTVDAAVMDAAAAERKAKTRTQEVLAKAAALDIEDATPAQESVPAEPEATK